MSINWKEVATIEFRYAKSIERDYREREEEINRMYYPNGQKATPVTRADIQRSARMWRAMVDDLERDVRREREAMIQVLTELEGWKAEALAARNNHGEPF